MRRLFGGDPPSFKSHEPTGPSPSATTGVATAGLVSPRVLVHCVVFGPLLGNRPSGSQGLSEEGVRREEES
jgi:hypothetical protein